VAERILLLDRWEAGIAQRRELVDVSAKGNRSFFRNEIFQAQPLPVSPQEWHLPESEVFEFDYSSSQRPSQAGDLPVLDDVTIDSIVSLMQDSHCSAADRVEAFRSVSHRFYVNCEQVREMLGIVRDGNSRMDLLVMIFFRIADVHNEKLFRVCFEDCENIFSLQSRLGYLAFFPFIQPEQFKFQFDFSFNDQRMAANLLFSAFMTKEGELNVKDPEYFLPDGTQDPLTMGIPRSWEQLDRMPRAGVFRAYYTCPPEDRKWEMRKKNLETYGGWSLGDMQAETVNWWATLKGVPEEVLIYLSFLLQSFEDPADAFRVVVGGDGKTFGFSEFQKSVDRMKFEKLKNPPKPKTPLPPSTEADPPPTEEQRLKIIFRFLNTSGEGNCSLGEFSMLAWLWKEIKQCVRNFATFIHRMFHGDLAAAWEYIDFQKRGKVNLDQFAKVCKKSGYFGMAKPIFDYLDADDNGALTEEKFYELEKFLAKEKSRSM